MCGSDRQIMSLDSRRKEEIGRRLWTKQREGEGLWTGEEPQCNKQGEFIAVGNCAHNLYSSCSQQNQIWDVTNFISKFIPECGHVPLIPTFFPPDFVIIIYVNEKLCVNQQNELNPSSVGVKS